MRTRCDNRSLTVAALNRGFRAARGMVLLPLAAFWLAGQQGSVAGPVAGLVFDSSAHALRPIRGIPGASLMGDPVSLGFDLAAGWVAPRQDAAVVVAADRSVHVFRVHSGTWEERTCDGLAEAPERVVFSPSGGAAALYAVGRVQVVTGLPDAPALAGTIGVAEPRLRTALRDRPPRRILPAMAISDDGALLLAVVDGTVQLFDRAGGKQSLMDAAIGAQVAFAAGGHDAATADPATGLVLFRDLDGARSRQALAAPDAGLASPAGMAFSADGGRLFVASAAARSVAVFDLAGGARSAVACDCTPEGLAPMGDLFRLNEPGSAPMWLLDAGAGGPRMVFVPAARAE